MQKQHGLGKKIVPIGLHPAVCVGVYDLGHHLDGRSERAKRRVLLSFELPMLDGGRLISKQYPFSASPKSHLVGDIQSWRGVPMTDEQLNAFNISILAGKPCSLCITHEITGSGTKFAAISGIYQWPHGLEKKKSKKDPVLFNIRREQERGTLDATLQRMPSWIASIIRKSAEVAGTDPRHSIGG